jgi:hypothetical protein
LLRTVDPELGLRIKCELERRGVEVHTSTVVNRTTRTRSAGKRFWFPVLFGAYGAEVSKRLDVFATALFHRMKVDDMTALDLSYTPPLSSPWDPVQLSCMALSRNLDGQTPDRKVANHGGTP